MAFNFTQIQRKILQFKIDLPKQIANEGQRYFLKEFDAEEFDGQKWRPRMAYRNLSRRGQKRKITRKLLVNTGTLRRAVAGVKREATWNRIRFEVFVQSAKGFNYAEVHNEGISPMPRRRFLGFSRELDQIIRKKILTEFKKAMR